MYVSLSLYIYIYIYLIIVTITITILTQLIMHDCKAGSGKSQTPSFADLQLFSVSVQDFKCMCQIP